jgi:hypothetical protein
VFEHVFFFLLLATGAFLALRLGWGIGHARWFGVKLGLVVLLLIPLEGMHAYVCHVWLAVSPELPRELGRALGMREMIRTLEIVLLVPAIFVLVWLSLARPF